MKVQVIPVTQFQQNCSLIWDDTTHKGALVDPGGDFDKIKVAVDANSVEIEKIILTHGHLDHVGATMQCADYYSVEVFGPHEGDKFWLDAMLQQCQMFGFQPVEAFLPNTWLNHNDKIVVGTLELEVKHCPGHTPGHVVLYENKSSQVIVGDVLFAGSIGRTDFPKGNHAQLIQSIKQQLFDLPDETVVYPGHGPTTTIGHEKRTNPFVADSKFG